MKFTEAFPSNYFRTQDLQGKPLRVVVANYAMEKIAGASDEKLVLHFTGTTRPLVLNKTNASTLAEAFGEEMDNWLKQAIELVPARTNFNGRMVDCCRVRVPRPARPEPQQSASEELDDEIPT